MSHRDIGLNKKVADLANDIIIASGKGGDRRENFFPNLINSMDLHTCVEIGVDKGDFSHCLLSKTLGTTLYGIDNWMNDFGSDHRKGYFDKSGDNRMLAAQNKLEEFGDRAVLIRACSADAAKNFQDECIDFCYIDGDHSLEGIYTDIYTWIHKVRKGGILSGHDYKDGPNSGMKDWKGNQLPYGVKTVVDFFCTKYGFDLNLVGPRVPSWWFIKNI